MGIADVTVCSFDPYFCILGSALVNHVTSHLETLPRTLTLMALKHFAVFCILSVVCDGFILGDPRTDRNVVQILNVGNGQVWGTFGAPEFCQNGTYATGFYLKLQLPNMDHDETGVNGIGLACTSLDTQTGYANVTSTVSEWGTWQPEASCSGNDVLTRFQLKVEEGQLAGDDTAVDGVRFRCRDYTGGAEQDLDGRREGPYGTWGQWSTYCPEGSGICGLSTKVEAKQDIGSVLKFDDTALNDALFYCCDD